MPFEIKHKWTNAVLYRSEPATTLRDAVIEATKKHIDLKGADLTGAYLKGADLKGAYLKGADLTGADLKGADLTGADLKGAYIKGAYLKGADLTGADLKGAYLKGAYLKGADLKGADLKGADLKGAYLKGADLTGADLKGAYLTGAYLKGADLTGADLKGADLKGADLTGADLKGAYIKGAIRGELAAAMTVVAGQGEIRVWKKIREGVIELRIPAEAKRSNATGRKCRAEFAVVVSLPDGIEVGHSLYQESFEYRVGETVRPRNGWCDDRWQECAPGIHFYITREEAEAHT